MKVKSISENISLMLRSAGAAIALSAAAGFTATSATADEAHARKLFEAMSEYMTSQNAISFTYNSNLEVVTDELQKIGFASTGGATLQRPDKLRVSRTGGFADVEMAYDGKTFAMIGKNLNVYAQTDMTGNVDKLIDALRFDYGLEAPAADLLSSDPYEVMMSNVTDVKDLGSGIIAGKECDHLAFRTEATDWEIWIAQGDKPYPCRFTITSKMLALAPSYTIDVIDFRAGSDVSSDDFQINSGDATRVDMSDLSDLSEVPDLAEKGEEQ